MSPDYNHPPTIRPSAEIRRRTVGKATRARVAPMNFFGGTHLRPAFVVQLLRDGHWLPLGTDKGITRHRTREAAEKRAAKTLAALALTPPAKRPTRKRRAAK